jgi:DNA repair exonuclease SbcCD nuclease subunit
MYELETSQEALAKLLSEIPPPKSPTDILVGHLAIEGGIFIGDEIDDMLNEIFVPPEMFKYNYTFMGHIHRFQNLYKNVYHVGSMERSDFGDAEIFEDKFIVLIDPGKEPEFIKIPNRNIRKIEISVPSDKDTTDFINNELCLFDKKLSLQQAIVKLEVTLASDVENVNRQKVTDFIYNKLNAHYICHFSETRTINSISIDKESMIDVSMNAESAIRQFFNTVKEISDEDKERACALALQINAEFDDKESMKVTV